jgi:hypothetical protein
MLSRHRLAGKPDTQQVSEKTQQGRESRLPSGWCLLIVP